MSETSGTTGNASSDDESVEFDETNGLAPGLDGDDGGAEKPHDDETIFGNLTNAFRDRRDDDTGETSYSEEGRP